MDAAGESLQSGTEARANMFEPGSLFTWQATVANQVLLSFLS
jgi:hypothetical protein